MSLLQVVCIKRGEACHEATFRGEEMREASVGFQYPDGEVLHSSQPDYAFLRTIIFSHGVSAKFNRLRAMLYLAHPKRTQRKEARRLGISERHFRRLLHELRMSYRTRSKA